MRQLRFSLLVFLYLSSAALLTLRTAWAAPAARPTAQTISDDMISPHSDLSQCLTVDGTDPATAPLLTLAACRGLPQQLWTHGSGSSQWQTGLDVTYCLATVNASPAAGGSLTVRLCTDSRALTLEPNPSLTDSYRLAGGSLVLDWGVYGKVALASQNGWDFQLFRWFQPDLNTVNTNGCTISYPLAVSDTTTYQRELACDHVAKMQPPFVRPAAAQRDPNLFPGLVPANTPLVTGRAFAFNLQFQDNSYARMVVAPRNWQSTGLYAPAEQVVDVTVSNATASELSQVYIQIGVHTDVLQPTSANVVNAGKFLRYPNVVTKVKLQPGLNQVRSPYGGLLVLVSGASVNKTINVQIDNAVEAPYFVAGQTTAAEWLTRRNAAAPWGEVQGQWAVLSVAASQLRVLSFAEVTALANFFSDVTRYHNEVSGLSPTAALPDRFPQGQQRFVTDKQIALGSAHSGYPTMFFDSYLLGTPAETTLRSSDTDWGMFHEFGHNYQMGAWSYVYGTETTVNIFSLHAQETFFGNSRLVDEGQYASAIALLNNGAVTNKWAAADAFQKLVFIDQLRLGFPNLDWSFWQQLMRRYRALTSSEYDALNADALKYDKFMTFACDITNSNLTPHFTAWTVPVTQTAKDYCATKPALTRQIWLIDNAQPLWYHPGSGSGSFLREYWSGISGTNLTSLTSNAAYPNSPAGSAFVTTALEGPQNFADNYGERLRAYLYPPMTGSYRFWLAGDDSAQLRLSTDADPLHATALVTLTTASGYRNFDAQALQVQRSAAISLTAGQAYYIEVLHKEGTGGDSVSVAWNIPATAGLPGEVRKPLAAQYLSPYTGDLALSKTLAPGQPSTILPGADVTFQLRVTNQGAATVHAVQIMDSLPTGFILSPAAPNGWATGYRYVQFQADSEIGATSGTTTVGELGLLDETSAQITKSGWSASANSQETVSENTPASKAIDNDSTTFWGSKWSGGTTPFPHTLTVDTGALRTLTGFTYLPRQSSVNGRVGNYKFYVSDDGSSWVQVAAGAFANTSTLKSVTFTAPANRRVFGTLAGPIAPGASATLTITLRAAFTLPVGTYTNTAQILTALDGSNSRVYESNSANNSSAATIRIGAPTPAISVSGNGVTIVNGDSSPAPADLTAFGTVTVGSRVTHTFTINNSGNADLTGVAVTVSGNSAFAVTRQPATTVSSGGSTTFAVTFAPSAVSIVTAMVNIASNDSAKNPYTFAVGGAGGATPPPGTTITIGLDVQPDLPTNLGFSGSLRSFLLDDPAVDDGDAYTNTRTFTVAPGSYTVRRNITTGWFTTAIACTPTGKAIINLADRSAAITVVQGDHVTCTYTVERAVTILARAFNDLVRNSTNLGKRNAGDPWLTGWTMTVFTAPTTTVASSVTVVSGSLSQARLANLRPGSYTVCTTLPDNTWTPTTPNAADPAYGKPCKSVTLNPGQVVILLFGAYQPTLVASETPATENEVITDEDAISDLPYDPAEDETATNEEGLLHLFLPLVQQ